MHHDACESFEGGGSWFESCCLHNILGRSFSLNFSLIFFSRQGSSFTCESVDRLVSAENPVILPFVVLMLEPVSQVKEPEVQPSLFS